MSKGFLEWEWSDINMWGQLRSHLASPLIEDKGNKLVAITCCVYRLQLVMSYRFKNVLIWLIDQ